MAMLTDMAGKFVKFIEKITPLREAELSGAGIPVRSIRPASERHGAGR